MKNKAVVAVIAVAAVVLAIIFIKQPFTHEKSAKKLASIAKAEKSKPAAALPAKKVFSKGMGALTVKIKGSNNKPLSLRIMAFSADSKNSSVFIAAFSTERTQELFPGTYDIEIDTVPAKIYKNVMVSEGKETVQDFEAVTGAINIKALNSKKKEASIPARILYPKYNLTVSTIITNRPAEIVPGVYNIDIETLPRQMKNDIKIEGGKETILDMGIVSGSVTVKAVDENGKEARASVRIKSSANNAIVASTITNRTLEVSPGEYDVEVLSTPNQTKKGVKIIAGEEATIEVSIQSVAQQSASKVSAPAKRK